MPNFANLQIDPPALMALGFLVAVLVMTLGLFSWLMTQGGKRDKRS